ncbi:MAG: Fe-S cluster assembly protein SufD [Pelagibacterales bacterium MED-G40]|nr:MAG: Fe-S cluster assembly protein SufD [Pelagibacterales bacterium MED-G40]|tara:strand:+ start:25014 stop:26258 length:1245 start_codon:yes stop_codon:yes gene_type:complete
MNFEIKSEEINKFKEISQEEKDFRIKNLKYFNNIGLPSKKLEDWKFTDLREIISNNFKKLDTFQKNEKFSNFKILKDFEHNYIILLNGSLNSFDFSFEDSSKIKIENYTEKNLKYEDNKNSLVNLNHALFTNGYSLEVESNYKFNKVVIIYNFFSENVENQIINKKNKILVKKNSELHLIDYTINKSKFVCNNYEEITLEENSILKNISLQKDRSDGYFHKFSKNKLNKGSKYNQLLFSSGLKFNKLDLEADLLGEDTECNIQAALYLNQNQHQEIKTRINHLAPNSKSYQKIKNVLNSNAKGIYQGKIYVKDIAQKTDAYQLSKALLLNDDTEFNSKPELEIYADDVKCSHGSTSGNVEEDSLYYLMTRGLSRKESLRLLINGFLNDIVDVIKSNTIKDFISSNLEKQIYEYK